MNDTCVVIPEHSSGSTRGGPTPLAEACPAHAARAAQAQQTSQPGEEAWHRGRIQWLMRVVIRRRFGIQWLMMHWLW